MKRFIVAEATKNWGIGTPQDGLISHQFEDIINVNFERGYKLKEWKMTTTIGPEFMTETIVAIFEKKEES